MSLSAQRPHHRLGARQEKKERRRSRLETRRAAPRASSMLLRSPRATTTTTTTMRLLLGSTLGYSERKATAIRQTVTLRSRATFPQVSKVHTAQLFLLSHVPTRAPQLLILSPEIPLSCRNVHTAQLFAPRAYLPVSIDQHTLSSRVSSKRRKRHHVTPCTSLVHAPNRPPMRRNAPPYLLW